MNIQMNDIQCNITEDDSWTVIKNYFKYKGFISHHLNSYNKFINSDIQEIIAKIPTLTFGSLEKTEGLKFFL